MSHISIHQCLLKGINQELLSKVLNYLAKQNAEGKVVTIINDWNGNEYSEWNGKPIIGAIKTSAVPRGISVIINDDGAPQFVGDDYNNVQAFKELVLSIQKTYIKMAYLKALNQMGYEVNIEARNNITTIQAERSN